MSQTGHSQYEIEVHDIPTEILKRLADYYDTSIDYILCVTKNRVPYLKSSFKNDDNNKNLNRLKEIREDRDLFQKDIIKVLKMSQTGYSKYEVGTNDIPTKTLKELAYFYDVSIDYLLYMTDERKCHTKNPKK